MTFQENRLQAVDSHKISYFTFFFKLGKMSQSLSSAAVVNGALGVKASCVHCTYLSNILNSTKR